jgi:pentatricopeptide repeat protein
MSLGSRIAKRARAAVNANLASTPREPLLFLYPQWTRNLSTSANLLLGQDDTQQDKSARSTTISMSPDLASPTACFDSSEPLSEAPGRNELQREDAHTTKKTADKDGLDRKGARTVQSPHFERQISVGSRIGPVAPRRESGILRKASPMNKLRNRVKRIQAKLDGAENFPKKASEIDRALRQDLRQMKEELDNEGVVDWRDILLNLKNSTPNHGPWLERALKVVVPEASMADLVHAIDGHIWDIGQNYDCAVVPADGEEGKQLRVFIVSGSLISLGKFTASIIRIAPNIQIFSAGRQTENANGFSAQDPNDLGRAIRPHYKPTEDLKAEEYERLSAEHIPKPEIWTPETFLEYVRAVVNPSISSHVKSVNREDKHGVDLRCLYVDILSKLFADPECKTSITKTACHEAMRYFLKVNMIADLRILFARMGTLKIEIDTETFNIMLRGTAKRHNLATFRFILHLMLKRGFVPNSRTWLIFMEAHSNLEIRIHIINAMREKGLLGKKSVVKSLALGMMQYEIEQSLTNNQSQESFIAHMDARYTPYWVSVWSGGRMLHALGSRGLISRCWGFLHFMEARFVQPNTECINTILFHCKEQRNLTGAIEVLRSLPPTAKYTPNEETFSRLFYMAWQSQNYNVIRVVWRYACLYGASSFKIRDRVFGSMKSAGLWNNPTSGRSRFRQIVGPVTFGQSYQGHHPVQFLNKISHQRTELDRAFTEAAQDALLDTNRPSADDSNESAGVSNPEVEVPVKPTSKMERVEDLEISENTVEKEGCHPWVFEIKDEAHTITCSDDSVEDISLGYTKAIFPFEDLNHGEHSKRLPQEKINILQDLIRLDQVMYKDWEPVKPMSLMLVEAAKKDNAWRKAEWEAKQRGEIVAHSSEHLYKDRQRMIDDGIGILIRSKDGRFERVWK